MEFRVQSQYTDSLPSGVGIGPSRSTSLFAERSDRAIEIRNIPPERVGLHGEYDHAGLSKRVGQMLVEDLDEQSIRGLRISQRGQVVIFLGKVATEELLLKIIHLTLGIEGASFVEVNGVCVASRASYQNQPSVVNCCYLQRAS